MWNEECGVRTELAGKADGKIVQNEKFGIRNEDLGSADEF
jgi:hypothetical protein